MRISQRPLYFLAVISMGIIGCSNYTPLTAPAEPTALAVAPVINESELPRIIAPLSRNVREGIAHSPNWKLVSESNAEVVLRITVLGVERVALARDPKDTGRPLSFHEVVQVSVEWDGEGPAPWGDDPVVTVESDHILYTQPSLVNASTMAMAPLADRLAGKILQKLDWSE